MDEVVNCVQENGGVKPMMAQFLSHDQQDTGYIREPLFREILHNFVGYNLSEHQIITIVRAFQSKDQFNPSLPTEKLFSILQTELKRINFQFFDQLYMNLREKDLEGKGKLPKSVIRINLVSGCAAAKSQLRLHNVNHIIEMLFKR